MARDITKLHPILQCKWKELEAECKKKGIIIKATECVRTKEEQDALYAKGRTAPGSIVTNAKGSNYSSMHQWGVAVDFGLNYDADKDGDIDIKDIYYAKVMKQVPPIEKSIGLESGYYWKSICDLPHMQLPYWGSTASKLKSEYKTPEKFMATWWKVDNVYTLNKSSSLHSKPDMNNSSKVKYSTVTNATMKKICKADSNGYAVMQEGHKFTLAEIKICTGYVMGKTKSGYWIPLFYNNKSRI